MIDLIRDSTAGLLLNWASGGRLLPFPDQRHNFVVPAHLLPTASSSSSSAGPAAAYPSLAFEPVSPSDTVVSSPRGSVANTLVGAAGVCAPAPGHVKDAVELSKGKDATDLELCKTDPLVEKPLSPETVAAHPELVTWYGDDDQENPRNWSRRKRFFVASLISGYTFSVYIASAIYTASMAGIMKEFDVIQVVATLGLSLFVLGYGCGPLFLGPLQDVVSIGRTPIYIGGLFLFVVFQVPVIFAPNIATLLVFRFLAGFVGSPALSTGGTSMTELFPERYWAYAIGIWAVGGVCGPIAGPVIGGFAAMANGWRWPIYELLWISGFGLIVLTLFLPETAQATILYRRAKRLRRLTGNPNLLTQYELDHPAGSSILVSVCDNFAIGIKISADPAIGFANFYIGLVYSIFYLWFETFPFVFQGFHHFNDGVAALPYLGFVVTAVITFIVYCWYQHNVMQPRMDTDPKFGPEHRLELGIMAAGFIPVSLLMFGWGAKCHWIVPIIGAALYFPGIFLAFQSILMFVSMYVKPEYNAAVMASNTFFRASFAAAFPLFGAYYVKALGVGVACTILAAVSLVMIPFMYLLYHNGARLRARSKWANHGQVGPYAPGH